MDTPNASPSTPRAARVCTNPRCVRRGELIRDDGACEVCWVEPVAPLEPSDGPIVSVEGAPEFDARVRLLDAERITVPTLRVRLPSEPVAAEKIPRELSEDAVRAAMRATREREGWSATWYEPEAPLAPFHTLLSTIDTARPRLERVGQLLTFFARAEAKGLSSLALFDDAVWVDPARGEDIVMLAGTPSERAWASNAARFVFSTWTAASDVRCEASSAEDALRWIHALGAVTPAPPPEAIALLRDALCEDRDAAWLARSWSELLARGDDRPALEGVSSLRYGAAQRAGRRKGADTRLPADYQQDRWCVVPVQARGVEATLLALADGVSTADFGSGAVAAARAIASIEDAPREVGDDVDAYLRELVRRAHEAVRAYADATRGDAPDEAHAPASTLTLALIDREGRASIAWVGDTPAFGWDPTRRTLVPLTFAHQGQYDALVSGVDARSARDHEDGKRLVRCLGGERCDPSLVTWRFGRGGGVVLATDGLVEGFAEATHAGRVARAERQMAERFAEQCGRTRHLQVACEGLCALSDELDGHDNLTVVAAFAGELPAPREREDGARAEKPRGHSNGALSGHGNNGRR